MRFLIALSSLCFLGQNAFAIPYTAVEDARIEGTVTAFVWFSEMQHVEDGTGNMVIGGEHGARYFVRLKAPGLSDEVRKGLACVSSATIRHEMLDQELAKGEVFVVINSDRLKELRVGCKLLLRGYRLFLNDESLQPSQKEFLIDGKPGTPIGVPYPPADKNNKGEQGGTGQPATRPESKSEGSAKPQPESEGRSR